MPSNYFSPPSVLLVGALAKAADINTRMTLVDGGFAAVQADIQTRLGMVATAPVMSNLTVTNTTLNGSTTVNGSSTFANIPQVPTSSGGSPTDAANVQYIQNALNIQGLSTQQQNAILFSVAMAAFGWLNQ